MSVTNSEELADMINDSWLLNSTYLVFYMQTGFCMREAGIVRAKNIKSMIVKNIIDTAIGTLVFWAVGFAFAFGNSPGGENPFIGSGNFFLINWDYYSFFAFQWAFSATATNIVSGSMAERTQVTACLLYTVGMMIFIYPIIAHWVWSPAGWLKKVGTNGMLDFAGASVVHMVGGAVGGVGAYVVGPRIGKFDAEGKASLIPGHSITLSTLGVFILWYGFYGFNTGSTLGVTNGRIYLAQKIAVNTTICATAACTTVLLVLKFKTGKYDIGMSMNGLLTGLVSSTAGCSVVEPYAAFAVGIVSGIVFMGGSVLLIRLKIDDPLDSAPIHLGGGAWGVLSVGLFATKSGIQEVLHHSTDTFGLFYGGGIEQLGVQIVGLLSISTWAMVLSFFFFFTLRRKDLLRIDAASELVGIDNVDYGGSAYPNFQQIL